MGTAPIQYSDRLRIKLLAMDATKKESFQHINHILTKASNDCGQSLGLALRFSKENANRSRKMNKSADAFGTQRGRQKHHPVVSSSPFPQPTLRLNRFAGVFPESLRWTAWHLSRRPLSTTEPTTPANERDALHHILFRHDTR